MSIITLKGGGVLGAILLYLITNTASWLFNPFHNLEYTKNLAGWIVALTKGGRAANFYWEFFRNTLLSGWLPRPCSPRHKSSPPNHPRKKMPEPRRKPNRKPKANQRKPRLDVGVVTGFKELFCSKFLPNMKIGVISDNPRFFDPSVETILCRSGPISCTQAISATPWIPCCWDHRAHHRSLGQ